MRLSPSLHAPAVDARPSPVVLGISVALVLLGWQYLGVNAKWVYTHDFVDFGVFYDSARCILQGCPRYIQHATTGANLNPPFSQWFFVPFAFLDRSSAFLIWIALSLACLTLSLLLVHRNQRLSTNVWCVLLAGLVASHVFQFQVVTAQLSPLLLVPLTYCWLHDRRGSTAVGDRALPLLIAWKPMLGLLACGRAWRRPRPLLAVLLGAMAILAVDLMVEGPGIYRSWIDAFNHARFPGSMFDGSVWQLATRLLASDSQFAHFAGADAWELPVGLIAAGLICVTTVHRSSRMGVDQQWLASLSGALLASPKGWCYYGFWLLPPALGMWNSATRWQRALLTTAFALTMLPWQIAMFVGQPSLVASATLGSVTFWAFLLVWVAALQSRGPQEESRS